MASAVVCRSMEQKPWLWSMVIAQEMEAPSYDLQGSDYNGGVSLLNDPMPLTLSQVLSCFGVWRNEG